MQYLFSISVEKQRKFYVYFRRITKYLPNVDYKIFTKSILTLYALCDIIFQYH